MASSDDIEDLRAQIEDEREAREKMASWISTNLKPFIKTMRDDLKGDIKGLESEVATISDKLAEQALTSATASADRSLPLDVVREGSLDDKLELLKSSFQRMIEASAEHQRDETKQLIDAARASGAADVRALRDETLSGSSADPARYTSLK